MKNLDSIFPFYSTLAEQYRNREDVDAPPYLMFSPDVVGPWVIRRVQSAGTIYDLQLYFVNLDSGASLNTHGEDMSINIVTVGSYDYITCNGVLPASLPKSETGYYLIIVDTFPLVDVSYYSETFGVESDVSTYIKLEFVNLTPLGGLPANFFQTLYVNATLKTPDYIREDTGEKRDGILIKEKQIKFKSRVLNLPLVPEYMVDCLIMLSMMDTVTMTIQNGQVLSFDEIRVKDPEWLERSGGSYAKMEIQFIADTVIKKLNFKEETMPTNIIKQGGVVVTVPLGSVFVYQVLFGTPMPDGDYTPACYLISTGDIVEAQLPTITNVTIHGFLITTLVACEVRWTAIKE